MEPVEPVEPVVPVGEEGDRVVARFLQAWEAEAGEDPGVVKRLMLSPCRTRSGRRFLR